MLAQNQKFFCVKNLLGGVWSLRSLTQYQGLIWQVPSDKPAAFDWHNLRHDISTSKIPNI
jgi:hypothetical protein